MGYPPDWRSHGNADAVEALVRNDPFAHFVTSHTGLRSTRIPLITDFDNATPVRLRGHLNRQNPQAEDLDGKTALATFDGPATYVSPNWRTDLSVAATYDYEEVQIRGTVRVISDIAFFKRLVDDLARWIEPQYSEVGEYPVWQSSMTPAGYVERLFPAITVFELEVQSIQMISKLHQTYPEADRRSIADHLARSHREGARRIAEKIRMQLED
ncbi:MAG: FMN-binding negative transcriptional regulator [Planctomycetes bacterium]|nr:FMN-binding negative transcriptional regulator [Planctomycetota bacterium]MCB9916843.1 FMN-binding negative transcriptional regulator [Planctomycetota bacterium]